jgi:hypothetical protein
MDDCNCGKNALKDNNEFNGLQTPKNTQSNRKPAGALKRPGAIPSLPQDELRPCAGARCRNWILSEACPGTR